MAIALALGVGIAFPACKATTTPAERGPAPSVEEMEGGRKTSPSRRASDERPRPWTEERGPFDSDRMLIESHRARKQGEETTSTLEPPEPVTDGGVSSDASQP
jgi:hypothetical protein